MCMSKNYGTCPCCGELVHESELKSNVTESCNGCEAASVADYLDDLGRHNEN